MVMGQCGVCGLVQISNPVPASELRSPYDWVTYVEPERHLVKMVDIITGLPGIGSQSSICGITFKDDSTLQRLGACGFPNVWRIHPQGDLGITDVRAGLETIQERLTPEAANAMEQKHGRPDVIVVRHILEHTHDIHTFMGALRQLVNPRGYIVFEVPDCTRALEQCDYSTLWEEHILYFTPETFRHGVTFGGFSVLHCEVFPYALENSLVAIVQPQESIEPSYLPGGLLEEEKGRALAFSKGLSRKQNESKKLFSDYRIKHGNIALLGAGHLGCVFVNVLELKDYIDYVVDDHPNKQGLFMPGSRIPIMGSSVLAENGITLCLSAVNPENEQRAIQNNSNLKDFLKRGGIISSIFPGGRSTQPIGPSMKD